MTSTKMSLIMLIYTLCTGLCFVWSDMIAGPAGGCSDWRPSWTPASTLSQASSPAPHQPVDVAAPCHGYGGACYSAFQGDMLGPCQDCKKSKTTFGVVLWISQVGWRPIQYLAPSPEYPKESSSDFLSNANVFEIPRLWNLKVCRPGGLFVVRPLPADWQRLLPLEPTFGQRPLIVMRMVKMTRKQ